MSRARDYLSKLVAVMTLIVSATMVSCNRNASEGGDMMPLLAWLSGTEALSSRYPVDGDISFFGLAARSQTISFRDVRAPYDIDHASNLRWAIDNDDRDVYIALEWGDDDNNSGYTIADGPTDNDILYIMIDSDRDGVHENGEDRKVILAAHQGAHYIDGYRDGDDSQDDAIGDGSGFIKYHSDDGRYRAEFMFPLQADTNGNDADLAPVMRYNFIITDHYQPAPVGAGYVASLADDWDVTVEWPEYRVKDAPGVRHLEKPAGLGGLIVFINKPEGENGSLYAFDPATGTVSPRISSEIPAQLDNLCIDGVSLSHDRTRIAFMGWTPGDISTAEVYVMNLDGTGMVNMTSNDGIDGHPAWSPDDTQLLYATYHDVDRGHVMLMDVDSPGTPTDLTAANGALPGTEENDPEWLPDGRVVFKTSRWTPWSNPDYANELRVAVMNADGSDVRQISFGADVVDHDPMGDDRSAVFERMNGPYDFALDERSFFIPWDIVEAPLDGSGEQVLISNVFVNWLPVYSPDGGYFVYIRNCGHSEARLASRDGNDYGRLIPGFTRIGYLDWK